ncbi:MAG: branched-chain amino acid ABC transporter permease [Rhodoferax sp.]|nr:branched-chain amino acid ABC transporter permease [Rhodoferax sp.]
MLELTDTVLQGLMLGCFYALSGLGLSLSFGIMRIVNIAHGDFLVLASYLGVVIVALTGLNPLLAVPVIVPLMFAVGYVLQRALLNRVVVGGELSPMLVTFGLSIILHNALQEIFSADFKSLDAGAIEVASLSVAGLHIGWLPLSMALLALCTFAALHLVMARTRFGRIVRATVDDPEMTALTGVDPRRVYALGMGLSMAIVAVAGSLYGIKSSFNPMAGGDQLLFAFETVIIGGMGSIWGTLAGGLALGLSQVFGLKLGAGWGAFAGHVMFFLFLFVRPNGLLARTNPHA